jgi:hypothetical protein
MPEPKFLENFDPPADIVETPAAPPPAPVPAPESKAEPSVAAEPVVEAPKVAESNEPKEVSAYKAAMLDERQKRQKLEQDAAYWKGRAEAAAKPPQEDEAAKKQKAQDLENRFLTDPVGFTETRIQEAISNAVLQDRWARSVFSVEREHQDWPAKRAGFLKLAADDPTLEGRANNHPDPARFAYEYMKRHEAAAVSVDLEAERKKIRDEERAAARKELALSDAGSIPPTLAGASGSGGGGSVAKDPDVSDLFKDKAF